METLLYLIMANLTVISIIISRFSQIQSWWTALLDKFPHALCRKWPFQRSRNKYNMETGELNAEYFFVHQLSCRFPVSAVPIRLGLEMKLQVSVFLRRSWNDECSRPLPRAATVVTLASAQRKKSPSQLGSLLLKLDFNLWCLHGMMTRECN